LFFLKKIAETKSVEVNMICITDQTISPEMVVNQVKTDSSGCVVTYVGLIREHSRGKMVLSVEYEDAEGKAEDRLSKITKEIEQKWPVSNVAIYHRVGKLKVGDVNLVVAVASVHRREGFAACQYAINQFKQALPTKKKETYLDGSIWADE
jgi:molybdopterin synthase catalytic subunit